MREYLYITREVGTTDIIKIGRTSRNPLLRTRELSGQSRVKYELLTTLETLDSKLAESWALEHLGRNAPLASPDHREIFICTKAQALAACKKGIAIADKHHALQTKVVTPPAPVSTERYFSLPKTSFWKQIGAMPVTYHSKKISLAELLNLGALNANAASRLKALGFVNVGLMRNTVEYTIDWSPLYSVGKFATSLGLESKLSYNSRVILKTLNS